jgi:N-acetylglucosaminyldiphosphoundecaprenol N-acetyl-beta-D-mannosaminyltransferase
LELVLQKIKEDILDECHQKKRILFYGDFNVLNEIYKNNLNLSNHITLYPDSTAVYVALKLLGCYIKKIVSTDLLDKLLYAAIENNKILFFFGNSEEVLLKIKSFLYQKYNYPCHIYSGYDYKNEDLKAAINSVKPDILFVGLGAGKQEKWVLENHYSLNAAIIITVGGWYCYLAGEKKRAPLWIRNLHMEWLHKLINEFRRVWRRYLIGIPLFYYRIITGKIIIKLRDEAVII